MTDLGLLAPSGDPGYSQAYAINEHGQVVGKSDLHDFRGTHAFLWEDGQMEDLGTLNGSAYSTAYDINDSGQVIGESSSTGFIWQNGQMTELPGIEPAAINNTGQVVGETFVEDLDCSGEVCGGNVAAVWQNDETKNLNDLINPDSGWELRSAVDINDEGQIVGRGVVNGEEHAFLLTPNPGTEDVTPPTTNATPNDSDWHNDGTVTIGAADGETGVKEITYSASGAQEIPKTVVPGDSATVEITVEGETTITYSATDNAGNTATEKTVTIKVDTIAPEVTCGAADDQWHEEDVSISCTASDGLSGLADPTDASFALRTNVPDGTQTEDARTNSRTVYDLAGNSVTAGPIGGNKIDKKPGGNISGKVMDLDSQPLIAAPVQVCPSAGGPCAWTGRTDPNGYYEATNLPAGQYDVTAFPPASDIFIPGTIRLLDVTRNTDLKDQDFRLRGTQQPPDGTTITPSRLSNFGIPVVYWQDPLKVTTQGCPGGSASYEILKGKEAFKIGSMQEQPAGTGTYAVNIPQLYPATGYVTFRIVIDCPEGTPDETLGFTIYIDPSGAS